MADEKAVVETEVTEAKKTSVKAKKNTAKKTAVKNENVIDITDFFTTTREKEGVWYELKIQNIGIGIEVLLYGNASEQARVSGEAYDKALKDIEKLTDEKAVAEAKNKAVLERAVAMVGGLRMKDGSPVIENGKEMKDYKKTVRNLFYENEDIRNDALAASLISVTFMR